MKEFSIEELKSFQCDMLSVVDEFCRNEHLTYFLAYGTLIGAVRHNGYIPWDDDIDIMMPRPDYDKFIRSFNGKYDHLVLQAPELTSDYYSPFANIWDDRTLLNEFTISHRGMDIGVKIDVFPIDGVPEDIQEYKKLVRRSIRINKMLEIKRGKIRSFSSIVVRLKFLTKCILLMPFSYSYLQRKLMNLSKSCNYCNSRYVDIIVWPVYPFRRFERDCISETLKWAFEGRSFMIPQGYDKVLTSIDRKSVV